jgi:DNA-binding GntR family transcriptional regulator
MSPGPTFDRVYLALKEQLMCGRFAPGDHLEPVVIGEELHSSITPVRDALHRLVGERLVEAPRNDGFRVPFPTEAELRDLYGWNRDLAELGLRHPVAKTSPSLSTDLEAVTGGTEITEVAALLFRRVARRSANPELEFAVEAVSDRLAAMRHVEARSFEDASEEIESLCALFANGQIVGLRRGVIAYHKRRQRAVPGLLVAARHRRDRD